MNVFRVGARAHGWKRLLEDRKYRSAADIVATGIGRSNVNRLPRLTLLAPDIQEAILEGRQPKGMQLEELTGVMPMAWGEQRSSPLGLPDDRLECSSFVSSRADVLHHERDGEASSVGAPCREANMEGECVVVLGAGATKACDGPLTNEILPLAFASADKIEREGFVDLAARFIHDVFGLDSHPVAIADPQRIPSLTLVLSIIDIALDRREALGQEWQQGNLANVRRAFDYIIFAVLERHLLRITHNVHVDLFKRLFDAYRDVSIISLNYDIIADNSMIKLAEMEGKEAFADYCCDIGTDFYVSREKFGKLLKLHGSLNWMYCPNCYRIELGIAESGRYTSKVLDYLYQQMPENLEHRYTCQGSPCQRCATFVRPMLISPSFQKDYRNPHTVQIWRHADDMLRRARKLVFIGYSLPEDDIYVQYLLKRAAAHLRDNVVTVVEYDPAEMRPLHEHPVGRRYAWLFGDRIDWHPEGFASWLPQAAFV